MLLYVPHRRRAKYWRMRDGKDEIQSLFFFVFNFETHGSNFSEPHCNTFTCPPASPPWACSILTPSFILCLARQLQEGWRSLHHGLSSPRPTSKGATGEVSSPIPTPHFYETYGNTAFPTFQNPCLPELWKAGTGKEKKKKRTKWLTRCSHKVCFTTS